MRARSALLVFAALKLFLDQLGQNGTLPNSAAKPAFRGRHVLGVRGVLNYVLLKADSNWWWGFRYGFFSLRVALDSWFSSWGTILLQSFLNFWATSAARVSCWLLLIVSNLHQHNPASGLPPLAAVFYRHSLSTSTPAEIQIYLTFIF